MLLNALDYILLLAAALGLLLGYYRGFIAQIISLSGFFLAYLIAFYLYRGFAGILRSTLPVPAFENYQNYAFVLKSLNVETYLWNALSFAVLFFGVKLGLGLIGKALNLIARAPGLNFLNRWTGAALGLAEALLLIVIAVNVMTVLPSAAAQKLLSASVAAPYLIHELPSLAGKLHELWKQ